MGGPSDVNLLYGHDACLPTEAALSIPKSPSVASVDDYKMELTTGSTVMETSQKQYQESSNTTKILL